jgi:hypothetical protein
MHPWNEFEEGSIDGVLGKLKVSRAGLRNGEDSVKVPLNYGCTFLEAPASVE